MMLTMSVAPALANDNNNNNNNQVERRDANLDRALLHELRTFDNNDGCCDGFNGFNDRCCDGFNTFNDGFGCFGCEFDDVDSSCPFWDDNTGLITWRDCLD
jgi:hypothetical protein